MSHPRVRTLPLIELVEIPRAALETGERGLDKLDPRFGNRPLAPPQIQPTPLIELVEIP
ncbi:hypothetical protein [Glaciibacter psychrotolerans]|uniref:Uncharacterized protein n=1 Tax=Glaciibacter psychrotolerans TaxID=670054 RepID=A0A7Z0EB40_9MICO|nr:hypothetical protein [Leifsonia psychrotolerans]NYJ18393.1 hypothetical protein [Leifsonia psychrotolerans]